MNNESRCVNRCPFFLLFIKQLFEISNSAGSLIGEAINLFRLFQRLSATKRFSAKFSTESLSWFKWVTDYVDIITSRFAFKPFTNLEYFLIESISIPLFLFTFIPALLDGSNFENKIFLTILTIPIGFGLGMFDLENQEFVIGGVMIGTSILAFLIFLAIHYCIYHNFKKFDLRGGASSSDFEVHDDFQFSYALLNALTIFLFSLIPTLISRGYLAILIGIVCGVVFLVAFIFELTEYLCYPELKKKTF